MTPQLRFFCKDFRWLLLSFALSLSFLLIEVPLWVQINFFLFIGWRWICDQSHRLSLPPRWVTNGFSIVTLALVKWQFGVLSSKESTTAYLLLLSSLKILEMRTRRDFDFVILLGLILIPLQYLWIIDIWILVPTLLSLSGLLWTWIQRDSEGLQSHSPALRTYFLKTFLYSLPVAAFLFIFFPRAQSPFGFKGSGRIGVSGFSGELNPGSVTDLVKSRTLAFRARFLNEDQPRAVASLYWVGESLILTNDGLRWRKSSQLPLETYENTALERTYDLILEPQSKNWIFVLEKTTRLKAESIKVFSKDLELVPSEGGVFKWAFASNKNLKFSGTQDLGLTSLPKTTEPYLQLPVLSEKVLTWIQSHKKKGLKPEEYLKIILSEFQNKQFRYSLTSLPEDLTVEKFFFETRRGFCEHFAAVTATLLRAFDVPARVLVGYHGGTFNRYGQFWSITQEDAHAWVEYVNSQGQWQRADPVQVIAPLRMTLGASAFFQLPEEIQLSASSTWTPPKDFRFQIRDLWDQTQFYFENLNYQWVQFLLEFNKDSQKNLLFQALSQAPWLIAFLVLLSILFFLSKSRSKAKDLPLEAELYERLQDWASKGGLALIPSEGPLAFNARAGKQFPHAAKEIEGIVQFYIQNRFLKKEATDEHLVRQAKTLFQNLRKKQKLSRRQSLET